MTIGNEIVLKLGCSCGMRQFLCCVQTSHMGLSSQVVEQVPKLLVQERSSRRLAQVLVLESQKPGMGAELVAQVVVLQ